MSIVADLRPFLTTRIRFDKDRLIINNDNSQKEKP